MASGALAVALNKSGVMGAANAAKTALIAKFADFAVPNPSPITGITIPSPGSTTNCNINISGGKITATSLSLSNLTQGSDGVFTVDVVLTGKLQFARWHEEGTLITDDPPGYHPYEFNSSKFFITFQGLYLTITIQMKLDKKNSFSPTVTKAVITEKKFTFHLPSDTALTSSYYGCVTDKVNSEIHDKIDSMTDSIIGSIQNGLNDAFSVIPESGNLTSDIKFLFPGTPGGLVFPKDNGVQYRVLGKVQWKGQDAPGDIGVVPFPPIPSESEGHDALFFANNYEFNALFWAFYKEGSLHFSFNKDNVKDESILSTKNWAGTELDAVAKKYPNRSIIIDLVMTEPPTVALKEKEADLSYSANLTYWVAKQGSVSEKDPDGELFKIGLQEIDALEAFAVSTNSKYLQLITFHVRTIKQISNKVISTNFPGLKPETVKTIWTFGLHPVYIDVLDKAAQAGVPLPSNLQGFFTNYKIELHPGYASAAVKFTAKDKYEGVLKRHGITISELKVPHVNMAVF